jgi:alkyl sulfatase BDS1-like metallo-beta-lactamase superfamily hydrolase
VSNVWAVQSDAFSLREVDIVELLVVSGSEQVIVIGSLLTRRTTAREIDMRAKKAATDFSVAVQSAYVRRQYCF